MNLTGAERRRFEFDDPGFDEVSARYRKDSRRWQGPEGRLGANLTRLRAVATAEGHLEAPVES